MTFDLSQYELEDTAILNVLNAQGDDDLIGPDGNPVTIELYGPGSTQAVNVDRKNGQRAAARMQALVRGKVGKNEALDAEAEAVERLVALTKKINNFPIEPQDLYSNPKLSYISTQVQKFLADTSNFSKG